MAQTSRSNPAIGGAVPTQCDPTPSSFAAWTSSLVMAAKLLGVELLDHVVIGGEKYVSLKERNLMAA